jgi:hypothetical protein
MNLGQPIRVPRECGDAERERLRQELERSLMLLSKD